MTKSSRSPPPPAAAGEGNGKKAAKKWVGWEEEVVLDDNGKRVVCYYLLCAPPLDGDGVVERDIAVVGKLWGVGNMAYSAHPQFLRSIDAAAARSPGPSRAVAVAVEATQLRWKSRREVMDWLTSLVADSPYRASGPADTSDGCALGDHDGGSLAPKDAPLVFAGNNEGGSTSTAAKDAPSPFAGNNPEGFAWLGPLPHLDKWRKHYKSFRHEGMKISVHDFIYIKSEEGSESNVGYVEDMYEDGGGNNMVLARWLDKPGDDHDVEMPSDVHDREVFFSYGLQDIGVNWVGGLAPVLNYQHFEWFQRREEEHCKWKPYLCHRQIVGQTLEPFNIAQLQGYANQEIVRALFRAPSSMAMVVHSKEPNKDKTNGGQKRKHKEIGEDKTVKNPGAPGNVTSDRAVETHTALMVINTVQKLPQCNATSDQIVAKDAPEHVAIIDQIVQKLPPCNATNDQTAQKLPPQNVISEQTSENNAPVNAPKTETVENKPPRNAAHSQAVLKLHPSEDSASGSGSLGSVVKPNVEELFKIGSRVEALSQASGIRGCWFRCQIVKKKRKGDLIKVKYQDIKNAEGTGHLKEWLRLKRIAEPDRLGIRLTGRPMIRPWPSNLPKIPSPVTAGTVVDVRLKDGWWEGIVVEPRTVGRVRVYFPGERKIGEFVEGDLRRSFEWVGDKWLNLMPRKDVASRLPPPDVLVNQVRPKPEMPKAASLLSSVGGARHAIPAGPKIILQRTKGEPSAKPMPPVAILESMPVDEIFSKPAAQNTSSQQSSKKAGGISAELAAPRPRLQSRERVEEEPAKPALQKTILHCSSEELTLQSGKKGPAGDPAKPGAEKVSLQYCQEENGMFSADGVPPDGKRPRVDLTNVLKSENVLKWAERKARGSGPLMGYSDGSSQEGIADSAPNGNTALVPVKEECRTNEEASVSTAAPMIDLSDV